MVLVLPNARRMHMRDILWYFVCLLVTSLSSTHEVYTTVRFLRDFLGFSDLQICLKWPISRDTLLLLSRPFVYMDRVGVAALHTGGGEGF